MGPCINALQAQATSGSDIAQQVNQLQQAMSKAQAQIEESQRELLEMRRQLSALQAQMAASQPSAQGQPSNASSTASSAAASNPPTTTQAQIQDIHDRQDLEESQIATHEQIKVESESKYPVKITGLLLLNGFVNTHAVDMPATPTVVVPGSGSTGASLSQTVLGFDARGPHLFGARSYANLRVDFYGNPQSNISPGAYTGYYSTSASFLRLRTAHAGLRWNHTDAFFSLDRPLFSADSPTSLTAVAQPALAWSGNLWTWNPQAGLSQDVGLGHSRALQLQGALIDAGDAPVSPVTSTAIGANTASAAESSRWPGTEAHIAFINSRLREDGDHLGVGGYFSPHLTPTGQRFDAWAATMDANLHLPLRLQLTSSMYRGAGLGGLGAGAYKDYVYRVGNSPNEYYFRPLDDVGGWAQLKEKVSERLEFNGALGLDNVFARQLRYYAVPDGTAYQNLARNRTYTGNVIYSPSAYLMFSLEYRHLESAPVLGIPTDANIIGVAAGYKF
jgi:hypothetical protein